MDKMITDKMTINLDEFSPFMKDIIVSNMNGTLVVTIKRSSRGGGHTQILKKPKELRCGISKGTIFCFSIGAGHKSFFLRQEIKEELLTYIMLWALGPASLLV